MVHVVVRSTAIYPAPVVCCPGKLVATVHLDRDVVCQQEPTPVSHDVWFEEPRGYGNAATHED